MIKDLTNLSLTISKDPLSVSAGILALMSTADTQKECSSCFEATSISNKKTKVDLEDLLDHTYLWNYDKNVALPAIMFP